LEKRSTIGINDAPCKKTIQKDLANVRKCLFEVSEACNLRCRYCIFSGKFIDRREHTKRIMGWKIAKKSFDFFCNWIIRNENMHINPYVGSLGFYGGEPLTNFSLIQDIVEYSKRQVSIKSKKFPFKFNYDITTNGLLLNEEKISYLIDNGFRIVLSIDGPAPIHEKNKGKGTFDVLMKIIKYIHAKYPLYYKRNIGFSVVYVRDTDLLKIRDFFSQKIFEDAKKISFGRVVTNFSSLKYPEEGLNENKAYELIKESKRRGKKLNKIEEAIIREYFRLSWNTLIYKNESNYGAFCNLGSKTMYFGTDGNIHGCEKVGKSFIIGNIYKGIYLDKLLKLANEWREKTKFCGNCKVQSMCIACLATTGIENKIKLSGLCSELKRNFEEKVSEYIEYEKI
jgi:uncharacterized protein